MERDMTVPCEEGFINIRVGAIIMKGNKVLMVGNTERPEYYYSVGGRVKFGETAEEAVVREVFEETGIKMEVDRLGFIHQNYFYGDTGYNRDKLIYEISFFFYMKTPEDFEPVGMSYTEDAVEEYLCWLPLDSETTFYPEFFRDELPHPEDRVKYFLTDERKEK